MLLRFEAIELDRLGITSARGGAFGLAITNAGSGSQAATIGGAGQQVELWGVLNALDLCLPPGTLADLVAGFAGDPRARDTLRRLLAETEGRPDADAPCRDVRPLIPLLSVYVRNGGVLPETIRARSLDIDVHAMHVSAPDRATSLSLPQGRLSVRPR